MGKKVSYIIYGLHSGDGVIRYVGRSKYGTHRLSDHRWEARHEKTQMPVHKWMRAKGLENIQIEILESCSSELELMGREDYWIDALQTSVQFGGLNLACGDRGGIEGGLISDETRIKMKASARARIANETDEQRLARLETLRRNGLARPFLGHKHTEESLARMRKSKAGKHVGVNNPNAKLSRKEISEIIAQRGLISAPELASIYNVSRSTIFRVWRIHHGDSAN